MCRIPIFLLALFLCSCSDDSSGGASGVSLRRTSHGIVHVTAGGYRGAGMGVGYAYTLDNYCLLAHRIAEVNGRLSEQLGAEAPVTSEVHDVTYTALQSDHYYRGWFDIEAIRAGFEAGATEVLDLADGYAEGVNRARTEREPIDCPVDFTADVTRDDVFRMWVATAAVASGELVASFLPHSPPLTAAAAAPRATLPRARVGSNAWAIGRDASRGPASVHLYNPHFPWDGIQRLYLVHVTIPGELDVMGAALGGFPLPLAGFTENVAWGLTFSVASRWSAAELPLANDLMTYTVDGETRRIEAEMLEIPVLGEPAPRQVPFYRAAEGPLLDAPDFLLGWGPLTAYAVHDVNATNTRVVEQFLRVAQAKSVHEVRDRLAEIQGVPWSYTVASDAGGDVLFADLGAVPGLTSADMTRCVTSVVGQLLLPSGFVVLDGSRSDCRWTDLLPADEQPYVIRSDYVANGNNGYELPNLDNRLGGYSPVLGVANAPLSLRASLGLDMIARRLDGSDGLGAPGFDGDVARRVFDQSRNRGAEILVDPIVDHCRANPTAGGVDLTRVCDALAGWDRRNTIESRGAAVFRGMVMALRELGDPALLFDVPASLDAPLDTPAGLTPDPTIRNLVLLALARVAATFDQVGIAPDAPWGQVHRVVTPAGEFPMPGGFEVEGIFDAIVSSDAFYTFDGWSRTLDGSAPASLYGASYLHVVELSPDGPRAVGLLPYGQSTDPASPYYLDQVARWSEDRWFEFPFTDAQIAADPELLEIRLEF